MKKLPATVTSEKQFTKEEAHDTVDKLIERNNELEDIFDALQPLLYTLSVAMYGEDNSDVSLAKLVDDSVKFLAGRTGVALQ